METATCSYAIQTIKKKVYLFFDNVHLLKNIRNNLLNSKKFLFPAFGFSFYQTNVESPAGYLAWSDFDYIYEQDSKLDDNLRKAYKRTFKSVHPFNDK